MEAADEEGKEARKQRKQKKQRVAREESVSIGNFCRQLKQSWELRQKVCQSEEPRLTPNYNCALLLRPTDRSIMCLLCGHVGKRPKDSLAGGSSPRSSLSCNWPILTTHRHRHEHTFPRLAVHWLGAELRPVEFSPPQQATIDCLSIRAIQGNSPAPSSSSSFAFFSFFSFASSRLMDAIRYSIKRHLFQLHHRFPFSFAVVVAFTFSVFQLRKVSVCVSQVCLNK